MFLYEVYQKNYWTVNNQRRHLKGHKKTVCFSSLSRLSRLHKIINVFRLIVPLTFKLDKCYTEQINFQGREPNGQEKLSAY